MAGGSCSPSSSCERVTPSTIVPFSGGRLFDVYELPAYDFAALAAILARVAARRDCCVVRGQILPHVPRRYIRRLCDRAMHGEAVTFEEQARSWLALDIDGVPDPDCFPAEPETGVKHVLELLPEPFREASCWWQATGGAGVKPGIRCRLWFKLSRDIADCEAKAWLAGYPVDSRSFAR